jgi:glycosyl-4,4'-diaponeurosporenoate acyltransferase
VSTVSTVATPVGGLAGWLVVTLNVVGWVVWMVGCGRWVHCWPLSRLDHDTWLTRIRPWEDGGRWYERRWRIRRWKDRLPEGGDFFAGGFAKDQLDSATSPHLWRFVAETRRAEYAHWLMLSATPVFFAFNAWWGDVVIVVFVVAVNAPCVMVQRYNRCRLLRVLAVRDRRESGPPDRGSGQVG